MALLVRSTIERTAMARRTRHMMPSLKMRSMSAFGPKQTCRKTQSMSLLRVKQTSASALQMSAYDPKRTF
jgi:hypothetical protein